MNSFLSCDWGTSSFRLRLIETATKSVLAEVKSTQGIAGVYALWKGQSITERQEFFLNIILGHIPSIESQCGFSVKDATIVISGMASSAIGMVELPYRSVPYHVTNESLTTHIILPGEKCTHKVITVSGVRTLNDVMRGEETMLSGCHIDDTDEEQLFIFPGTHSKHVIVKNRIVTGFKTYMTGELFYLLSTKSILAASVESESELPLENTTFAKAVNDAVASNILNSLFQVRTNQLFNYRSKTDNYYYLSGLLIGEELKDTREKNYFTVTVVSAGNLLNLYHSAIIALALKSIVRQQNADKALIEGQALVIEHHK